MGVPRNNISSGSHITTLTGFMMCSTHQPAMKNAFQRKYHHILERGVTQSGNVIGHEFQCGFYIVHLMAISSPYLGKMLLLLWLNAGSAEPFVLSSNQ